MRSYSYLLIALALLFCLDFTIAIPQSLVIRQDEGPPESAQPTARHTAENSRSPSSVLQSEGSSAARSQSERPSQTPNESVVTSTLSSSPTEATGTPTRTALEELSPSATAGPQSKDPLPIHPKITPAIGVAGAILLLSGLVYTVIGIKNKWLYVFGSAAYLSSLAVTVLIVYLMSPPVSDAVQGGFFVAAFFTGVLFGGLSLAFPDMTEGLGCLLGGFCLSMWFLTLKQDGLITSQTGRSIFIGVMSAAGFSLSFSHYTRTYGLIVCISVAGATICMLGIDCFSRAGWKEFWLYLWGLNENTFPLDTNSYPMTRGIRAELAGVIIVALFGIVSQMRLWKVVREHRENGAKNRMERDRELRRQEEEAGRKIQDDFSRDRAQWEAMYGEKKNQQDSAIGSSNGSLRKTSTSIREQEISPPESVEMMPLPQNKVNSVKRGISSSHAKDTPASTTVTISVLQDENEIQVIDAQGRPILSKEPNSDLDPNERAKSLHSPRASIDIESPNESNTAQTISKASPHVSVGPPPAVVPLPFTIPTEEDAHSVDGDNSSVSAEPESVHSSSVGRRRFSKRISGHSVLKRLSTITAEPDDGESESLIAPHIPYIEEDRASSIAATFDDDNLSMPAISPPRSPTSFANEQDNHSPDTTVQNTTSAAKATEDEAENRAVSGLKEEKVAQKSGGTSTEASASDETSDHDAVEPRKGEGETNGNDASQKAEQTKDNHSMQASKLRSLTASTDPKPQPETTKSASPKSLNSQDEKSMVPEEDVEATPIHGAKSVKSKAPSVSSQTSQQVRLSKDVLPERMSKVALSYRTNEWAKHLALAEEPELEQLPEVEPPTTQATEKPAPVTDEIISIEPAITKRASKRISSDSAAYRTGLARAESTLSRNPYAESAQNLSRSPSVIGPTRISRTSSGSQLRNSTNPYFTQSPDGAAGRFPVVPTPPTNATLMGQRESLVRSRFSSQSFQNPSAPNLPLSPTPDQEMTLAQRKQIIQQQQQPPQLQPQPSFRRPPSAAQKWQNNSRILEQEEMTAFDSHQPRRASYGQADQNRREDMMANWRESIRGQQVQTPVLDNGLTAENQMIALMQEKRQKEIRDRQMAAQQQQRESMMGNMMRSGEMLDAHREAMRRMQASANRSAS